MHKRRGVQHLSGCVKEVRGRRGLYVLHGSNWVNRSWAAIIIIEEGMYGHLAPYTDGYIVCAATQRGSTRSTGVTVNVNYQCGLEILIGATFLLCLFLLVTNDETAENCDDRFGMGRNF